MAVLIISLYWLGGAIAGWAVGKGKGRALEGFVLGALFGLLGVNRRGRRT